MKIFFIDFHLELIYAFFYGIYNIQFKCKLCKDNNICYENFHYIFATEFMDAFLYGIDRFQFKCKLCKDNTINVKNMYPHRNLNPGNYSICFENFHHISVPEFMDAFFYSIYKFNLNVNCVKTITVVIKFFMLFLFQGSWMHFSKIFLEFNLNVNCVKTITFVIKIFIIFLFQSSWMPSFTVFIEFN